MAKQEHLDILKQGVTVWNQWRQENPKLQPDLSQTDLHEMDLRDANLSWMYLYGTNFMRATLIRVQLTGTHLHDANFYAAYLREDDLTGSFLSRTNFSRADLRGANLSKASIREVNFVGCILDEANLANAFVAQTIFGGIDFRMIQGLDTVKYVGPSDISLDAIYRSEGAIPENFLRGAGVPDSLIDYAHSLVGKPIDFYSCFISCSSKDLSFAKRLYADLQSNGVRCWFAPEDLKIGDYYHQRIDESIRLYDKLILILSQHSIQSVWVEREVVAARENEDCEQRPVLFPLRLDDAVMNTTKAAFEQLLRNLLQG